MGAEHTATTTAAPTPPTTTTTTTIRANSKAIELMEWALIKKRAREHSVHFSSSSSTNSSIAHRVTDPKRNKTHNNTNTYIEYVSTNLSPISFEKFIRFAMHCISVLFVSLFCASRFHSTVLPYECVCVWLRIVRECTEWAVVCIRNLCCRVHLLRSMHREWEWMSCCCCCCCPLDSGYCSSILNEWESWASERSTSDRSNEQANKQTTRAHTQHTIDTRFEWVHSVGQRDRDRATHITFVKQCARALPLVGNRLWFSYPNVP